MSIKVVSQIMVGQIIYLLYLLVLRSQQGYRTKSKYSKYKIEQFRTQILLSVIFSEMICYLWHRCLFNSLLRFANCNILMCVLFTYRNYLDSVVSSNTLLFWIQSQIQSKIIYYLSSICKQTLKSSVTYQSHKIFTPIYFLLTRQILLITQQKYELSGYRSLQLLVRRMQLKKCKTNEQNRLQPLKQHSKIVTPVKISPKESHRKSNTSTHLSERSCSTRKLFLPRSNKLSNFFNQSAGHYTVRKTLTSTEPNQVIKSRPIDKKQTNKCERIEFLKFNVNKDYFDDQNQQKPLRKNISKHLNLNKNGQYQQRYQLNDQNQFSSCTTSGQNSYSANKGIQSERQIVRPQRMKSPRTLVHPVTKIMQKSRGHGKIYSAQSLEYTFGLQS